MARFDEGRLRVKPALKGGKLVGREQWISVSDLEPIRDSRFPDIKSVRLKGVKIARPAEVKYRTSEFAYHRSNPVAFRHFAAADGFVLVLAHDYLPKGLAATGVDVFELDKADFEAWCRANFGRLFGRQIGSRAESKLWVMYQGPNFYRPGPATKAARESHVWCPTESLTSLDLAPGDRVLFARTSGASTQSVQKAYLDGEVLPEWFLQEVYVALVSSKIRSRREYCQWKRIPYGQPLWTDDPHVKGDWRWGRVFEFHPLTLIRTKVRMKDLESQSDMVGILEAITQAFCYTRSRELGHRDYTRLLETLVGSKEDVSGSAPSQRQPPRTRFPP